jgi:plasmid segregation protein ParM
MYGPCLRPLYPRATYWKDRFATISKCLTDKRGTMIKTGKNKVSGAAFHVDQAITIGLDIGYGLVKAVTPYGAIEPFPSVYGLEREIKFRADEIARKYPGDQITDDEGSWWIGNLALSQLPQGELLRLRGRTADEESIGNAFRVRLAKVAIGKILAGRKGEDVYQIRLATGLPVDHMRDAASLKKSLIGQHLIDTDSARIVADIVDVMVMPQPYGTIYSQMLTDSGDVDSSYVAGRTGVVDVGTYTIDLALDDNGEYIDAQSGSTETGVFTAQQRIEQLLERELREKPSYQDVESVLRTGRLKVRGNWRNYDSDVEEALEPLRRATLNLMNDKWRTGARVDRIPVAGGGASLTIEQIQAAYPHAELLDDPQGANARGYYNYAMAAERNAKM